ncbi:hypothetical protein KQX54_014813 [Cotesia glomerata]|uniref:Uncharacterized protein n=1 Tax=Cotesia glomerata TaxID=32391 RepID=A0AAV7IF51_COTGL|nr:hypothetical protein KQX54_014813 [Cotesia glomerata]
MLSRDISRSKAGTVTVKQSSTDGIVQKKIKPGHSKISAAVPLGRPPIYLRLTLQKSTSCPSITGFLEKNRKRSSEEAFNSEDGDHSLKTPKKLNNVLNPPVNVNNEAFQAGKTPLKPSRSSDTADIETQESSNVENNSLPTRSPVKPTNHMSSDANVDQPDPDVMDRILNEIAALRAEQDLKHTELKNKLESNLMKNQAAFTRLEESLSNLKNEIAGTKTDLSKRISILKGNTVKINQIEEPTVLYAIPEHSIRGTT